MTDIPVALVTSAFDSRRRRRAQAEQIELRVHCDRTMTGWNQSVAVLNYSSRPVTDVFVRHIGPDRKIVGQIGVSTRLEPGPRTEPTVFDQSFLNDGRTPDIIVAEFCDARGRYWVIRTSRPHQPRRLSKPKPKHLVTADRRRWWGRRRRSTAFEDV